MTSLLAALAILLSVGLGLGLAWRTPSATLARRAALTIAPAAAVLALALMTRELLMAPWRPFNDARLAPAAAWLAGVPLYGGVGDGPLLGLIYPPLAVLAYLPAAAIPNAEAAVLAGAVMSQAFVFGVPVAVLLSRGRSLRAMGPAIVAVAALVLLAGHTAALQTAFWVHADAPALFFASAACALLRREEPGGWRPAAAALCTALALASKQVALPLVIALPAWLLVRSGRLVAERFVIRLVVACGLVGAACLLLGDPEALLLDVVVVPLRHPWTAPAAQALPRAALTLLREGAPALALLAGAWATAPLRIREAPWTPWLVVAVTMLPASLAGRAKMGGDLNALGFTLHFVAVAAALALLEALASERRPRAALALVAAVPLLAALAWPRIAPLPQAIRAFPSNPERQASRWTREHPGQTYFPAMPLVAIVEEGRVDHFSDAVYSRMLAGVEVPEAQVRAHLPPRLRWIAYQGRGDFSSTYLPEFSETIVVPGLSEHFTVKARPRAP